MFTTDEGKVVEKKVAANKLSCYHCGASCITANIHVEEKVFCCEGCKLVYEVINQNGLCDYYQLSSHPGLSQVKTLRSNKYAYLDAAAIAGQLYKFYDGKHAIVTLYIPGVHCSSCMWLLEHMHKLNDGIVESRLNFTTKEVTIRFLTDKVSLRKVVELLATLGYEPHISLDDSEGKKTKHIDRRRIYKLGVAGFCFGNIMLMSFPEYLSSAGIDKQYTMLFRVLNLILSVPVFFYAASEFFVTAWAGLKQKILNIDAPIALALIITYARSLYEIFTGIASGYLDSMSGIVFFMLVGRVVQERTYKSLSFHRDYKAYFPIAVDVLKGSSVVSTKITELKENDIVQLHNDEIIPADGILIKGNARIDYSFVTGESEPVQVPEKSIVYAGGRQKGDQLLMQVIKPVVGSYLTSLWNNHAFSNNKTTANEEESIIHKVSKYFTIVLFILAAITALYWAVYDASKILPAVSAMLIVACPCALLLSATYTNGNLLRIFSNNGLFLRDATVIEQLGNIDHIVFDKTGTLTQGSKTYSTSGHQLSAAEEAIVYSVAISSQHPHSVALCEILGPHAKIQPDNWVEIPGSGVKATIGKHTIRIGSAIFTGVVEDADNKANVYVRIDDEITAYYFLPDFRDAAVQVMPELRDMCKISLLSGDNNRQEADLRKLLGQKSELLFAQKPVDKLTYIAQLQQNGTKVAMIGDGLNDAGALQQSNVGITLTDDINNFTPSCDAILDASRLAYLPRLLRLARSARSIINLSFIVSILYNIVGLYISVRGDMEPMIAAILMPASTLSIILITTGASSIWARRLRLSLQAR